MKVGVIIPAAGSGRRIGGVRKAFMNVGGKPMLQHVLDVFRAHPETAQVVVALASEDLNSPPDWLKTQATLVAGGTERADSVRAAAAALANEVDAVLIHDAARPLITIELIDRVLAQVRTGRSATLAVPVTDTLHEVDKELDIRATPDRTQFWRAQTPQGFPRDVLEQALRKNAAGSNATDEASIVAAAGFRVRVVPGEPWNIKVTTPADIAFVESVKSAR